MRDIIFRGKRLDNGEWVYGEFCPKDLGDDAFGPLVDKQSIIKMDEPCSGFWFEVDPTTVGQFTGLLDKHGKRIFEGDIATGLNCTGMWTGYVIWIDKISGFGLKWIHRDEPTAFENIPMLRFLTSKAGHTEEFIAGVIGNIHDNPELLEGD